MSNCIDFYAECHYAVCCYTVCNDAECRGALAFTYKLLNVSFKFHSISLSLGAYAIKPFVR
jgi:hypothetical protein